MPETVVLLHGFGGTRRAWDPVLSHLDAERYRPLALDLRGHGEHAAARPVDFPRAVADVLASAPERFALCGYSLGGRVALHAALAAPERVSRLVLVATTAGIEDDEARAARRAADEAFADELETLDAAAFAERWMAQPVFAGTPVAAAHPWREDLLRTPPSALAVALRGLSPGVMEPVWHRLGELHMPTTVIAGGRDTKYLAIAKRLVAALPDARMVVIPDAGHGLPREAPEALAAAI